jgi:hypothetical protein
MVGDTMAKSSTTTTCTGLPVTGLKRRHLQFVLMGVEAFRMLRASVELGAAAATQLLEALVACRRDDSACILSLLRMHDQGSRRTVASRMERRYVVRCAARSQGAFSHARHSRRCAATTRVLALTPLPGAPQHACWRTRQNAWRSDIIEEDNADDDGLNEVV